MPTIYILFSAETTQESDAPSTVPADAGAPAATATKGAPADDANHEDISEEGEDTDVYRTSFSPFRALLLCLVVLVVSAALFVYCGGLQWTRRMIKSVSPSKGRYKMVRDQDLEK
ncbi:hypothetical protein M0805_000489 [Coniferiporia weirii]|nr:hypothetical protein M0805_000489 [Coniferiporia weirii]